ncbi:SAV_2336 N-terminal domain-related protein [Streptomyces sp. NPDC090798]|uniref:SAV_2336 N-terminal domain-related protein n=1 Tax=Streptomyces sp. NPDC090798 TaxID=3365968 RepID=UPI0037FDFA1B
MSGSTADGAAADGRGEQGDGASRPATGVGHLARLLAEARGGAGQPTSVELAELLWLAGHIESTEASTTVPFTEPPAADPPQESGPGARATSPEPGLRTEPPKVQDVRVPLRLPDASRAPEARTRPHTSLLAPAPPMLSHPLALQRALRPLKRLVPAPVGLELDEEATAHHIARLDGAPEWWLPVLRPATERWLTLHLVYDSGPTMPVWRSLLRELHTALIQSGVFRTVELRRITADGTVRPSEATEPCADGRTVTLVLTDCMGPQWREGIAGDRWYRTLRRWATRMPVALIQPIPERLWRTTALPAATAWINAPQSAAPNSSYHVDSYVMGSAGTRSLPLPVLEPSAPWLANWARLLIGTDWLPGATALLGAAPPLSPVDDQGRGDVERLSPGELLLRFRSLASPEAFRLAGHLAVARPELPVMRLVQAAIETNPRAQHLAEVILSGVLTTVPGPAGSYAFRPGVRELLLRTLPRTARSRTAELVARVGALIDTRAGVVPGEFRVAAPGGGGATAQGEPIAMVREETVQRLGGAVPEDVRPVLDRYRLVRELGHGSRVWQAEDSRTGRAVAVYRYDAAPDGHQTFLGNARALADVRHPNVVSVHDFGVDDRTPWLVTEFMEGVTLAELTAEGGFRLPYWMLASLAHQVAKGIAVVHGRGLTHGRLTPNCLMVCPDGTVKVTRFALGQTPRGGESDDLGDLGRLLAELSGGTASHEHPSAETEQPTERRTFRALFTEAVTGLRSQDLDEQRHGRNLLLSASFDKVLSSTVADRDRYRLLGPVRITREEHTLPLNSPQEQALLCMLLLRSGRTVTYAELMEGMWGERLPEHPARDLALHASRLRSALGPGVLATTGGGYALHTSPRAIDVNRCTELADRAKFRREDGDTETARDTVQYALDLWEGDPLDGVPGPAASTARTELRSLRITLCVTRAELDLELGRFEQAAHDLAALLSAHPGREDLRQLHALALRGLGRGTEAIESQEE